MRKRSYPLTPEEYNVIVKVASHTGCDCWLKVWKNWKNETVFYDLDRDCRLTMNEVIKDLYEAYEAYGEKSANICRLTPVEEMIFKKMFKNLEKGCAV